jgi:hypothetical protein
MADVDTRGPLFDGRAARAVGAFCDDVERDLADHARGYVQDRVASAAKHRTGQFEGSVRVDASGDGQRVTDGGIVYGPWLEGVWPRNRATRFAGYRPFRLAAQRIQADAGAVAERTLQRYIGRMQ